MDPGLSAGSSPYTAGSHSTESQLLIWNPSRSVGSRTPSWIQNTQLDPDHSTGSQILYRIPVIQLDHTQSLILILVPQFTVDPSRAFAAQERAKPVPGTVTGTQVPLSRKSLHSPCPPGSQKSKSKTLSCGQVLQQDVRVGAPRRGRPEASGPRAQPDGAVFSKGHFVLTSCAPKPLDAEFYSTCIVGGQQS